MSDRLRSISLEKYPFSLAGLEESANHFFDVGKECDSAAHAMAYDQLTWAKNRIRKLEDALRGFVIKGEEVDKQVLRKDCD